MKGAVKCFESFVNGKRIRIPARVAALIIGLLDFHGSEINDDALTCILSAAIVALCETHADEQCRLMFRAMGAMLCDTPQYKRSARGATDTYGEIPTIDEARKHFQLTITLETRRLFETQNWPWELVKKVQGPYMNARQIPARNADKQQPSGIETDDEALELLAKLLGRCEAGERIAVDFVDGLLNNPKLLELLRLSESERRKTEDWLWEKRLA